MAADQYLVHYVYDHVVVSGMVSAESGEEAGDLFEENMKDFGGLVSIDIELVDN